MSYSTSRSSGYGYECPTELTEVRRRVIPAVNTPGTICTYPAEHNLANMCSCGTTIESRTHIVVGECEMYKEIRDALEEMRKICACDMEESGRLESSEKTIAILGDRWWPQTAKKDGDRISKQFLCSIWKNRNGRPNVGGVSMRSRNGAPSPKGCVVNGQITKPSNK